MKPRVCIFAAESLLHWSSYYVRAFRQCCDVIVIGPKIDEAEHDYPHWPDVKSHVVKNDIHCTSDNASTRLSMLPEGWNPDLVVGIQSGEEPVRDIAFLACPTVYLSIDTWHDPRELQLAHQYDFVFVAQKALIKYMHGMGCSRAFWLPLACAPEHHRAITNIPKLHDIVFVGTTHFYANRQRRARLTALEAAFDVGLYSGLGTDAMAEAYGRSRLIFNASIACDVNMRVFEALATGLPLVTNREAEANGLFDLFEDGVHLITYDDEDLTDQIQRYLDDPVAARAIGKAGQREVLDKHTYAHRVNDIFATLRDHHLDVGARPYPKLRTNGMIRDLLPLGSMRVLDIGLGLNASRISLLPRGVEYVAGAALDDESRRRRSNSYDVVWPIDDMPEPTGDYHTIVWTVPGRRGETIDAMLATSQAWLLEGGRVFFFMSLTELRDAIGEPTSAALRDWLHDKGCQLLMYCCSDANACTYMIVVALVSTGMPKTVRAMYAEFPANGVDAEPWEAISSEPTPDSPSAEDP